jgi:hypothetical protein
MHRIQAAFRRSEGAVARLYQWPSKLVNVMVNNKAIREFSDFAAQGRNTQARAKTLRANKGGQQ